MGQRDNIRKLVLYKENKDVNLRNEIVMDNQELVWYCVNKYTSSVATKEDMFQAGIMGLMIAIERFEPQKGFQLSTFALSYITNEIRLLIDNPDYIDDHEGLEPIDEYKTNPFREKLDELYSKVLTEDERLVLDIVLRTNDEPAWSFNDISKQTGIPTKDIKLLYASGVEKLNQPWVRWYIKLLKEII